MRGVCSKPEDNPGRNSDLVLSEPANALQKIASLNQSDGEKVRGIHINTPATAVAESQREKLTLLPAIPQIPSLLQSGSAPKSVPVCCSPTPILHNREPC